MSGKLKERLAERVVMRLRELNRKPLLSQAQCRTALRKLGMTTGNAQRLFDDSSDVQLSRVEELAAMLKVTPGSLLSDDPVLVVEEPPPIYRALPVVLQAVDKSQARAELRALLPLVADPSASQSRRLLADLLCSDAVEAPPPPLDPGEVEAVITDLVEQIDGDPAKKRAALIYSLGRVGLSPSSTSPDGPRRDDAVGRGGRRRR